MRTSVSPCLHGDGQLASPLLQREGRLGVDLRRARGGASIQMRGADGPSDGVQVGHHVPTEDRADEVRVEAVRFAVTLGQVLQKAGSLIQGAYTEPLFSST